LKAEPALIHEAQGPAVIKSPNQNRRPLPQIVETGLILAADLVTQPLCLSMRPSCSRTSAQRGETAPFGTIEGLGFRESKVITDDAECIAVIPARN
jgi:hypothetical protein